MEPWPLSDFGMNQSEVSPNNAYYNPSNPATHNNSNLQYDFRERFLDMQPADGYLTKLSSFATTILPWLDPGISNREDGMDGHHNSELEMDANVLNNSNFTHPNNNTLPIDMQFNEGHRLAIIIYSLLMLISAVGNISVFSAIIRLRIKGRLSRINLFLLHLAIADLLVTFLMMPLEIVWNATVSWRAGDAMCRIMSFFRIFGLLLSGFVLVCISLDRYFAILKPLGMPDANSRGRTMLAVAWLLSVLCSLPQSFIFHVERHPEFHWYEQCVTFNSFPSPQYELAYNFFGFFFLYGLPLIMIIFCYSRILFEIYRINALKKNEDELRRSNMGALGRAKIRTLKMTIIIVATFFFCWTPYNVMSLWYWFDKKSALEVDQRIQKGLFLFACTNSCVNPVIYGLFHFRPRKKSGSAVTVPRSIPNGSLRPPIPSENYKMRVRWRQPDCIMTCGSSGNSDTTQVVTTTPRGRSGQHQHWVNGGPRHFHSSHYHTEQYNPQQLTTVTTRRGFIATTAANCHPHADGNGSVRSSTNNYHHHHNGHRRCSNFQLTEFDKHSYRTPSGSETSEGHTRSQFIEDKMSKRPCLSSIL